MVAPKVTAMLNFIDAFFSKQSPCYRATYTLLLVAIVGMADYVTGYELSFSVFYLIPVSVGAWYLGGRPGLLICVVSATTWLGLDYASGHPYSHPLIPVWNAGVRFGFFITVAHLLERLQHELASQEALAQTDGLTGILNARTFSARCNALFELALRHQHPLALGYLDLDGFKGINDRLGHSVGDQVLQSVATVITQRLRASDVCARIGGDEFACLLPETDYLGAQTLFTGLYEALLELANRNHWPIGFSIGVAVFRTPMANPDAAIRCADNLMYQVKKSGKNRVLLEEFGPDSCGK